MSDLRSHAARGRLGGLTRASLFDGTTVTAKARATYADSFLHGHECSVCKPITIPEGLPLAERQRRAAALRKLHYTRIGGLRGGRPEAA